MQTPFPHCEICGTVTILFTLLSEGAPFSPASCPEYKLLLTTITEHLLQTAQHPHQHRCFPEDPSTALPTTFCSWRLSRGDPKQGHQRSLALNLSLSVSNPSTKYSLHTRSAISRRAGVGWGTKKKQNKRN